MKFYFKEFGLLSAFLICNAITPNSWSQSTNNAPLTYAIAGLTHGHVYWALERIGTGKTDAVLVGIYEPDKEIARKIADQYKLNNDLFYTNLPEMLDKVKPEAVTAFGSIYEHMQVVEACAPRGIHVMVEKPLATNTVHAARMKELVEKHHIHLLTNYETSAYPTTEKIYQLVNDSNYLGKVRKTVIHDGHEGPKEIGVSNEFFAWLADPVQNGGGALIDFGCYGANLMTYLMQHEDPVAVTAVTRQYKPAIYPNVDDDATIIVDYPSAQCIIQASWNWPFGRKDMEVYGETGYLIAINGNMLRLRNRRSDGEKTVQISSTEVNVYDDPVSFFADVVSSRVHISKKSPYSLENNLMVVKILEAARESARTGKTIIF